MIAAIPNCHDLRAGANLEQRAYRHTLHVLPAARDGVRHEYGQISLRF